MTIDFRRYQVLNDQNPYDIHEQLRKIETKEFSVSHSILGKTYTQFIVLVTYSKPSSVSALAMKIL